jgi:competence protein ComEA
MSGTMGRSVPRCGVASALFALGILVPAGPSFGAAPSSAMAPSAATHTPAATTQSKPVAKLVAPIDINSASAAQLKTLQGIGDAEARRIIARRPYHTKAELVTANVIPAGIYQANRHRIIAVQPGTPRPEKHP